MKKCLIISGGQKYLPDPSGYDYIIACDKGYQYAKEDHIVPDLILGDFDSFEGTLDESLNIRRYKVEKDDTDTMIAIKQAIEDGYDEITLCCALGNREDHGFANIQSLGYIAAHHKIGIILGSDTEMYCCQNTELHLKKKEGYSLSVFSISDHSDVSLSGTKYTGNHLPLTNTFPLGQSNQWAEDQATITIHSGIVLIIHSRY